VPSITQPTDATIGSTFARSDSNDGKQLHE
jgi:hypothetical protein